MRLKRLTIKDKKIFNKFLKYKSHHLSVYAFANIYIWKGLFKIYWKIINNNLLVFFYYKDICFLYMPPLGEKIEANDIERAFAVMDAFNQNKQLSRIENVEKGDVGFYESLGYECKIKSHDYICKCRDLFLLRGNKFKSKRISFNYFIKHYKFKYSLYSLKYKDEVLKLYDEWASMRKAVNEDPVYKSMLKHSRNALVILLKNYRRLDIDGRIVIIDKRIRAFTFGFKIDKDMFCVLYEVTDLSIKGASRFIFRKFCEDLKSYKYINLMDDSGLKNLRNVKLSYRPALIEPSYIAVRKN